MEQKYWPICRISEVSDPGSREFDLKTSGNVRLHGFVVHYGGCWYAYRNSCPHTGVSLNWLPNQFFDMGQEYIQCGVHGALFQPQDGLCIYGPCLGRYLQSLPLLLNDGLLVIDCENLNCA